jgi:hypothetical protein
MTEIKHTPAPWRYQEGSDAYTHTVRGPNNRFVAAAPQDSPPMKRKRLSPKAREALWDANQRPDGSGGQCCYCDLPIVPGQAWEVAHDPVPHAFGGTTLAIAHKRPCHAEVTASQTVPTVAKAARQRRQHIGAQRPGMGSRPLPGGRDTKWKAKIGGGMEPRLTLGEKMARLRELKGVPR